MDLMEPSSWKTISTGAKDTYKLSVTPRNGLVPELGQLVVTFPAEIIPTASTSCVAYEQESLILLNCIASGQLLIVSHDI